MLITDSIYSFIVYIDLVMQFRRKSHLLLSLQCAYAEEVEKTIVLLMTLLPWRRFGGRKRKSFHDNYACAYTETEMSKSKFIQGIAV